MRKLFLFIAISMLFGLAFASEAEQEIFSLFHSSFEVLSSDQNRMEIDFHLPEFEVEEVFRSNQTFHKVRLAGAASTMKQGYPELPFITTSIAIPHQGNVTIEVQSSQQSVITSYNAFPVQQGDQFEAPKAFIQNHEYYSGNGSYPEAAIEYSDPMIMRDFRIITVQINPFSHNAESQELTVHRKIRMQLNFNSEPGINELPAPVQYITPGFDAIYNALILNYHEYRNMVEPNTPPRYLIIHGNTSDNNFFAMLNGYVLWKKQKGAEVDVFSTQQTGSSNTAIQSFIRSRYYNNTDTRPDFVILIGDTVGSYAIPCFDWQSGATDYPYSFMNTGDNLGDLFVGRISVESLVQFSNLINKGYLYERNINLANADWLNRMLLIGDWAPSGISTMYINKYIKEIATEVNPDYTFTEAYSDGPSPHIAYPALSNGVAMYSFRGHIDFAPPTNTQVDNGPMLPHTVVITCRTGNFDQLAQSEQFIRLGTDADPKGAITSIGMATSYTHTTFNNTVHGGIFGGVFTQGMRTMSQALLYGKLYLHQIFGVSSPQNVNNFAHWCNLMGDPTVEVFVGIPDALTITTNNLIPAELNHLEALITDQEDRPVKDATVTLSLGMNILTRGYTDEEGRVVLELPANLPAGSAVMTVSKHDCKPAQTGVIIDGSGTLAPTAMFIDDTDEGDTNGNGDGVATAGEIIGLTFSLTNTTMHTISGISGTLVSDSPYIQIPNSVITFPDAHTTQTVQNAAPMIAHIHPATPPNAQIRLHILLTDDEGNQYDILELLPVDTVELGFVHFMVNNDVNGVLDPDEERNIMLSISSNSHIGAEGVYARLYSENQLLSIIDGTFDLGTLPASYNSVPNVFMINFTVWLRPETLPGMVLPLYVKFYNDEGFEQYVHFTITVGTTTQSDPLGPCEYGYVIYDMTDTSYPECPSFNWIEIAPQLGGDGTALPITDTHVTNNEGDQVGAQSLAVVNLPFQFQFYGRRYSQITVCSNGFIALGVSENGEFRNFRLPGAMGPNPMIAPFWDDLATHAGSGIYTYFDRGRRTFIVEWYNMKNGKDGTSAETFQVILYDPAYYASGLGDGPIKFQYYTFNNVDSQTGNRHGNYATIGIKDHTGMRGLEYTFNNTYPTAAAPLANGSALYITTVPTYYEEANIQIAETYITVEDGILSPGKEVSLGVLLENVGNMGVDEVQATLSTADSYVSILHGNSLYHPIGVDANSVNKDAFRFLISEMCPGGHVINFDLHITSGEMEWTRQISMQVVAPQLVYHSQMIDDYQGNFDGIINIGESIKYIVNIRNKSDAIAKNVSATLSTGAANIIIGNPHISDVVIQPNKIMQIVFDLQFTDATGAGNYLPLLLVLNYSGMSMDIPLTIPYNIDGIFEDFELNSGRFVSETGWQWGSPSGIPSYSGDRLWATNLSGQYPDLIQYYLYSPQYYLAEDSQLSFMHYYDIEAGFDGANLSISTDSGNTWTLLSPVEGYDSQNIPGIDYYAGWTGASNDWISATFDLSSYADEMAMFRFRFGSDASGGARGWFIDDLSITNIHQKTGFIEGSVYLSSMMSPKEVELSAQNGFACNPKENGDYRIYLPYGSYSLTANLSYHRTSSSHNLDITTDNPILSRDFTLLDLPPVSGVEYTLAEDESSFEMSWAAPVGSVLDAQSYRVYRKFDSGPFEIVQESQNMSYHENYAIAGKYLYLIAALYQSNEGEPTMVDPFNVGNADDNSPQLITALGANYPNPFNPETTIRFTLAKAGKVELNLYNLKGQKVKTLLSNHLSAGSHELVFDGFGDGGKSLASGVYLLRMVADQQSFTRKITLMK